jgi:membrane protease YdiL (CAAX protease family)
MTIQLVRGMLSILMIGSLFGGMFAALSWVVVRIFARAPLFPERAPRVVPWGLRTVLLVLTTCVLVNALVVMVYVRVRGSLKVPASPAEASSVPPYQKAGSDHGATTVESTPPSSRGEGRSPSSFSFTQQMALVSVINTILLVLIPLILRLEASATLADVGIERDGLGQNVRIGIVAFFLVTPAVYSINAAAQLVIPSNKHPLELMLRQETSSAGVAVALLSAIVLAPMMEELLFRAVLQGWLERLSALMSEREEASARSVGGPEGSVGDPAIVTTDVLSPDPASPPVLTRGQHVAQSSRRSLVPLLLTSGIFAVVHAPQMPAPIPIFFLSLALGTLYRQTGSLIPSLVVHSLFNGFSTVILLIEMIGIYLPDA